MSELETLHKEFMQTTIIPLEKSNAKNLIESHQIRGDTLVIITATNSFITRPIADYFGVQHLIETEPEIINNRYTTNLAGTPCYQEGKVSRLNEWLENNSETLKGSVFYSDSHNDIPLLEATEKAIEVDPDEQLQESANKKGWDIISLK